MSKNKQIAIILPDTLQRMGLYSLFMEYFSPIEVVFFSSFELLQKQSDTFDFYFTNPDIYLVGLDYFLLRKSKTYILVDTDCEQGNINILPIRATVETLIDKIQSILTVETCTPFTKEINKELSSREIDVLQQIVRGETNKEIADILNISLNTVLTHRKNITSKLGIKTVPGLTFYAIMNGIVSSDDI